MHNSVMDRNFNFVIFVLTDYGAIHDLTKAVTIWQIETKC